MEAFTKCGRLCPPNALPETSSLDTPIYASCIDYESPNNIANEKKKQYERVLEDISDIKQKIVGIHADVNEFKSKTEPTAYDRRSINMLQYVPSEARRPKPRYLVCLFRQWQQKLRQAHETLAKLEKSKNELERAGVHRW